MQHHARYKCISTLSGLFVTLVFALTNPASAAIILQQTGVDQFDTGNSAFFGNGPADNFTLNDLTEIQSISFRGNYFLNNGNASDAATDQFQVEIFSNAAGNQPGTNVYSFTGSGNGVQSGDVSYEFNVNHVIYDFSMNITNITLAAGDYWMIIRNMSNVNFYRNTAIAGGDNIGGMIDQFDNWVPLSGYGSDLILTIEGDSVSSVAAPSSIALMALCLVGVTRLARKTRINS